MMNYIKEVCEILKMSEDEVLKNSKEVEENITAIWQPYRGGLYMLIDNEGNYLCATSGLNPANVLEEFKIGEKNKKISDK